MMIPKPPSRKRAKREEKNEKLERYRVMRANFLHARRYCEAKAVCRTERVDDFGIRKPVYALATDIHHMRGRGRHFLDESTWLPVCRACHEFIESERAWAQREGFLLSRHERNVEE